MIKRLDEYEEYQESLKEVEKQRVKCENQKKLFEEFEKANLDLDNTLGIKKIGELPDFEKISKSKEKTRIAKREMDIANERLLFLEEYLKETIEKVKNLRKIEIKKEGLKLNKKILKIFDTIDQIREKYRILKREIKQDFEEELELEGGYRAVIGADPTYVDFSNKMAYSSEAFRKDSKKYQSKEKDEIKDI